MKYFSTRDKKLSLSFKDIFLRGLAPDGGLFLPSNVKKYNNTASVYYSYMSYGKCFMVNNLNENTHYISVSGIAQNKMFHKYCKIKLTIRKQIKYVYL